MLKAGAAALDITPPLGVVLAGSYEPRWAAGIDDPLHARALVLEDESGPAGRIALVCCDLIAMPGETVAAARALIARSGDVPSDRVLIAATHTHTAPSPTGLLGTPRADAYMDALPERLATVVRLAAQRLAPARAGWGTGHEDGVAFNRRFRMRDGTVRMNPGALNPEIVAPCGPIDPELGVLWVEREDGSPVAVVASFALHYVGTDRSDHVSADYFGHYARWMQRIYGPDLVPMLFNGAQGDVNGVDIRVRAPLKGHAMARRVAGIIAGETLRVVERLRPAAASVTLGASQTRFSFRRKRTTEGDLAIAARLLALPEELPARELRGAAGLDPSGPFSWVVGQPLPDNALRLWARECQYLAAMPEELETELQALRVGNAAIVSLPGEAFVELGLAIKRGSPFGPEHAGVTLVAVLANDYAGYIGTRRAIEEEGSYETWAARSSLPAAGTGEAMVEETLRLLGQLAATA
ncbi:MAG TPA: hypothetical protein VNM48_16190 [Chloroflexota bacterium]|nr:hypothetical protein [Chloroflexota bacterium]